MPTALRDLKEKAAKAAGDFKDGVIHTLESNPVIQGIKKAAAFLGFNVDEGFRSKEGIDSHSDSKKAISATTDFFGGIIHTLQSGGLLSSVASAAAPPLPIFSARPLLLTAVLPSELPSGPSK